MDKKQILVVGASTEAFKEVEKNLTYFGYLTRKCATGRETIELVNSAPPDFILAEIELEDMDGIELCWLLRETSKEPGIPFILLTEKSDGEDAEIKINALRSGVDALISKKAPSRELITHIESLFKRMEQLHKQEQKPHYALSGFLADFSMLEVLQMLHMSKKSGTLRIVEESESGRIGFLDGNMNWAKLNLIEGEDAVSEMVLWQTGFFEFDKNLITNRLNIKRSTMEVILNCSTLLDEKKEAMNKNAIPENE